MKKFYFLALIIVILAACTGGESAKDYLVSSTDTNFIFVKEFKMEIPKDFNPSNVMKELRQKLNYHQISFEKEKDKNLFISTDTLVPGKRYIVMVFKIKNCYDHGSELPYDTCLSFMQKHNFLKVGNQGVIAVAKLKEKKLFSRAMFVSIDKKENLFVKDAYDFVEYDLVKNSFSSTPCDDYEILSLYYGIDHKYDFSLDDFSPGLDCGYHLLCFREI
ncbi:MAG: hypothetical protein WC603_01265 [Candidatus Paceibacterota bacterium]|jgi:hypothetical protein